MGNSNDIKTQAAAAFKKQQQHREGAKALSEYEARLKATRDKTSRLRALRLAKEAADLETDKKT